MTEVRSLSVDRILESFRKEVIKSIEKLNKKTDKLGVDRAIVTLGESYDFDYTVGDGSEEQGLTQCSAEVFDISIEIPQSLKFNGWEPIAFIDHKDKVSIQMDIDADYEYDFELAIEDNLCGHCNTRRNRRKSWILQNKETQNFIKVGSTCVKDFTGVSPDNFFKMFKLITEMVNNFGDEDFMSKSTGFVRNPENYITYEINDIWTIANTILDIDGKYIKSLWEEREINRYQTKSFRTNEGESTSDIGKIHINLLQKDKDAQIVIKNDYCNFSEEILKEIEILKEDFQGKIYITQKNNAITIDIRLPLSFNKPKEPLFSVNRPSIKVKSIEPISINKKKGIKTY